MKKENETTNNSKPMAYDALLCTVIKRCKDCKNYKQHRCMKLIDDAPEVAVIRFPNAITKCTMFEKV